MPARLTINDMKLVASDHGGKCLSKEYVNNQAPLKWMCEKGHTWDRSYAATQQGLWCSQCIKNKNWLDELKRIAEKRGGKLISDKYKNINTAYKWECKEKHPFSLRAVSAKQKNAWCPVCRKESEKAQAFNKLKLFAKNKGGALLSTKYENKFSRLKWKCSKGHVWYRQASNIMRGEWCKDCRRGNICKAELGKLKLLAEKKGGKCLSESFERTDRNLKWQCKEKHIFLATPKNIKKGTWCKVCSLRVTGLKLRKYTILDLERYAKDNKGRLITKEFKDPKVPVQWECSEGHRWISRANAVLENKRWCIKCHIERQKLPITEFQKIAKSHGGKLLSDKYINSKTVLKWQCAKGHLWTASPERVKKGSWCTKCAKIKLKKERLETKKPAISRISV